MVENVPLYPPTGTMVSSCSPPTLLPATELAGSSAARYSGVLRTATWPRRRTVSMGSLMKRATAEEQILAREKVTGAVSRSIWKWLRRTSGADRVKIGWTREWRRVGTTRRGGQM